MKGHNFEPAYWAKSLTGLANQIGYPDSAIRSLLEIEEQPQTNVDAFVGLLTFDGSSQVSLEIPVGMLLEPITEKLSDGITASKGEYETADAVYGYSQKGDWLVLRDVSLASACISTPGFSTQTLRGSSLLAAKQPISAHPRVDHLSIALDGLNEWVRLSPITEMRKYHTSDNGEFESLERITITYESDSAKPMVLYTGNGCEISIQTMGVLRGGPVIRMEHTLATTCTLEIELDQPADLDEALHTWVYPMKDFLVLLTGLYCSIKSIGAHACDTDCNFELYAPYVDRNTPIDTREVIRMPFPYPAVKGRTQQMIAAWFGLDTDARNAANIVISLTNSWLMPYDLEFVACASAFEALSRVGEKHECFEQIRFDNAKACALAAVEDTELQSWMHCHIWNERSARSLAKALLKKLQPVTAYLIPDDDAFQNDHRACRNAYVHRSDMESDEVLEGSDLYPYESGVAPKLRRIVQPNRDFTSRISSIHPRQSL